VTHVLITGGLGFLGQALVAEFAASGFDVRIFNRRSRRPAGFVHPAGHPVVWGDIRDPAAVSRAVEGMDIVVHTVSNFREARTDRDAYPINVGGSENILRAAAAHGAGRVVICSTIGVHGSVREAPAGETSPCNPGDIYQETKVEMERKARAFEREHGLPVCILRPASLYGPGDLRMLKLFRLIQRRRFVLLGRGDAFFHPAYIDDVARAFVLAATHPAAPGETFIIGGDQYLPLRDLIQAIARHLHVPPPGVRLPLWPADLLARACEAACRPFGIEPPLHRRRMSFFRNNRAFTIAKATSRLGYLPRVSLDEGLARTIAWYEMMGYLPRRAAENPRLDLRPAASAVQPEADPAPGTTPRSP
jgi:nucleoside-diphosphate-sugar epimerase